MRCFGGASPSKRKGTGGVAVHTQWLCDLNALKKGFCGNQFRELILPNSSSGGKGHGADSASAPHVAWGAPWRTTKTSGRSARGTCF